ncbi:MAG: hypothetical protein EU544_03455, partial [Promethearchaeota archaeon]
MSGFAHFFLGLSLGFILMYASRGRFSSRHVIIFSINNYIGPDIGTVFWYFFGQQNGQSNLFGFWILQIFHTLYGWPLVALLYAWVWVYYSQIDMIKDESKTLKYKWVKNEEIKLTYRQCYELCVAGGILHLFLDALSTLGAKEYEWYLSTGTWGGKAYFTPWVFVYFVIWLGLYLSILFLFSKGIEVSEKRKIFFSGILI